MRKHLLLAILLLAVGLTPALGQNRITYKSAKSGSSYYQMAVQISEAIKNGSDGELLVTVEESQGSVQNVKEAPRRGGSFVFTSPPSLIGRAMAGEEPFDDNADYQDLRGLFPIPSLTMHFVVRADAGIESWADLADKDFIIGKGSFGARKAAATFEAFGVGDSINLVDVELNAAVPALKNRQVHVFATAGSYPAPNVMEAAASTDIRLLSMDETQLEQAGGARLVIPAGAYPGVDEDTTTVSLPVGAYTLAAMDEETAYRIVEIFWAGKSAMAETNPWWGGVTPEMLATLAAPLHPGALRYYQEAGVEVPEHLR